ncbi:hypothetical protein Taro_040483 [Colocasia esculenta]|uniref:Uncharacterized protein n=1 Tax=Colocasia esculenta TaxID=4460 RepID=A0A843WT65_COLES|nr:hypothetical protein [Colocasia esculenta]
MWTLRVAVAVGGIGVDANLRILQVRVPVFLELPTGSEGCLKDRGTCGGDESREETPWRGAIPVGARGGFGVNQEIAGGFKAGELGVKIACRQAHQPGYKRLDRLPSISYKRQSMLPPTCALSGVCCHGGHEMTNDRQVCGSVGPFVRDCEAERLFLCCVVRVGYWPDQPVVRSRVVASFPSDSCFAACREFVVYDSWSRLEGDQVRRGPVVVEAPVPEAPEAVIPPPEDQSPANEDQPQAPEDQPQIPEEQPLAPEDQPHIEPELQLPQDAPLTPPFHNSSPTHLAQDIPTFTPQPQVQTSYAFGGPSVPPELYSFLNDKFDAFNTSIQHMTESFELKVQRLENTMSAKFIEQKAASDHTVQRFNRLIGTLADASIELKEHQDKLEMVLQGILANSQADVFNTKETLTQISKTRLSFAHLVDDLESMKNLSAHIDSEMSDLKKELKNINKYGLGSSSSSAQHSSVDLSSLQYTLSDNSQRLKEIVHTRLSTMQKQLHASLHTMGSRLKSIEVILLPIPPPPAA